MPKVIWKGHLNFGLVNVPVRLYSATQKQKLDFHLVDKRDQSPVGYVRINKDTGREVRPDEIARSIETEDGHTVVLEDEDFERFDTEATRSVDIRHFVRLEQIDPAFFEKPYYLAPMDGAEKSYALLREVIRDTQRVGIAKVVLRKREHLAAVMVREGVLTVNMLRFADQLRDPGELEVPTETPRQLGISTDEFEMATELVRRMTRDWEPEQYHDEYREELLELIEEKARRAAPAAQADETSAPAAPEQHGGGDLGQTLRDSIDRAER